jgi:hypothetical protein
MTRRQALEGLAASYLVSSTFDPVLAAPVNAGEYAGQLKTLPGGCIALSTDGNQVVVYICDGTYMHPPTLSHWMRGEMQSGSARIAADGFTLLAEWQLQGQRVTGMLTLPNGTALPFVAYNHWPDGSRWSVYRSEEQFGGVTYVGGWIANPPGVRLIDLSLPRDLQLQALSQPVPDDDSPRSGGGIINQQTGAVLPYVEPNLTTMTVEVSGLGTFRLHRCIQTKFT